MTTNHEYVTALFAAQIARFEGRPVVPLYTLNGASNDADRNKYAERVLHDLREREPRIAEYRN